MSNKKTVKIVITEAVNIGGERQAPGTQDEPNIVELDLHEGRRIVNSRKAVFYVEDAVPADTNSATKPDDPDQLKTEIMAAIEQLDEGTDFTKGGTPKVKAVEKLLGYDVTAGDVTAAWDAMEEDDSQ